MAVTVRTTTPVPEGRAGLAYPAIPAEAGFGDEAVYVCGLRQNEQDRSNLAFQNMGESGDGAITLRTTVFSGDVDGGDPRVLEDVTLAPGGFHQYSGLLETAGFTQGYARVERVSGTAPFYAYGVINDQVNSDGSFVSAVRESSLAGAMGQTLPSHCRNECLHQRTDGDQLLGRAQDGEVSVSGLKRSRLPTRRPRWNGPSGPASRWWFPTWWT